MHFCRYDVGSVCRRAVDVGGGGEVERGERHHIGKRRFLRKKTLFSPQENAVFTVGNRTGTAAHSLRSRSPSLSGRG